MHRIHKTYTHDYTLWCGNGRKGANAKSHSHPWLVLTLGMGPWTPDTRHRHLNFSRGMSRHFSSLRPPWPPIVCLFTNWAMCYGPVKIKPDFTQPTPIACCIDMLPLWLKQSVTLNVTFYYMLMQGIVCLSVCSPETEGLRFCLN